MVFEVLVFSDVLACFLLGAILFTWRVQQLFKRIGPNLLFWYRVCFITIFVILQLEEMLGLLYGLVKLSMIDVPAVAVSIYWNHWTSSFGWKYCQNTITLYFDWPLLLVLPFLCINRGEKIKHQKY